MKEFETITVTNGDGKDIEYEFVFELREDEAEESEDIDLYISKVVFEDGKEIIEDIEDEKEWNQVAKVLDDLFREQEENNR